MTTDRMKLVECGAAVIAAASALAAAVAAICASVQFREAQELQSESLAYQSWERFLEFSVENPKISSGYYNYEELKPEEKIQYEQYVDRFLVSAEQILIAEPEDNKWHASLMSETRRHYSYLTSNDFIPKDSIKARISGYCSYDLSVRELIKQSLGHGARSSPVGLFQHMDDACERTPKIEAAK